jgi:hypothetical protein
MEIGWEGVDWIHLAQDTKGLLVGSCGHSTAALGYIKSQEFLD